MPDKQNDNDTHRTSPSATLPDSYEEISSQQGIAAVEKGTRIIEFINESGATVTLFEKYRTGYVIRLMPEVDDADKKCYEIDVSKVVDEELSLFPTNDGEDLLVEAAIFPLMEAGWEITYYDEEHSAMRMSDLFRR